MQENYINELIACVNIHKAFFPADFFIVVITKTEPLMPNVMRNFFAARLSCPTPDYDQSVYKYDHKKEEITYLWTIPSKDACIYLLNNASSVDKSEQDLLKFVQSFSDGTLFRIAQVMNHEEIGNG